MKHTSLRGLFKTGAVLWVCCIGLLGLSAAPAWAQCNYSTAADYPSFAIANAFGQMGATKVEYEPGYGPSDDKDGDGLTNLQEFNGWGTTLNGVPIFYGWDSDTRTASGSCLEDVDADCDGMSDYVERRALTNPQNGDTDGDGMGDAWEVYVGLDPRDNGTHANLAPPTNPDNAATADPDGDGLSNIEEMSGPNCGYVSPGCATAENPFTQLAYGADDFTLPLSYDSDGDRLIDSYEYGYGLDPLVANDADADPDADGLTTFREQCVHPLLANYWSAGSFSSAQFTPSVTYSASGYTFGYSRIGLVASGYLNLAQYNAVGDSASAPGNVLWGHPVSSSQNSCFSGTRRWTSCNSPDTDGDMLPDGWELEHGLNPLTGSDLVENGVLHVSGPLGDPDEDALYNYQEYFGQDGYRIDYITGTGDETDPWITRIFNNSHHSAFASRIGQVGMGGSGNQSPVGYGNDFIAIYAPGLYPGFFDPVAFAAGNYVPVPGVPPFVALNDLNDPSLIPVPFNGKFDPFATAMSGILFKDNVPLDGRFTPGVDDAWLALAAPGVYTPGDPILAGAPVVGTGEPIELNLSLKWPIPGTDTDDDGLPDALEIQMDVAAGKQPTSPVQSHNPFRRRSAKITGNAGISPYLWDRNVDGRRFFSRDFTIETWVYLADVAPNDYRGAFIQGAVWLNAAGTIRRVGYELGVETNAGIVSVPYVSFNTLAEKRYKVAAAASLPKNRWVHLAGVFDPTRNGLSLYIDGLLEQSLQVTEESSATFGITKGGSLTLALDKGGPQRFANNLWLDEVRIWGVPRASDEIADNRAHLIDPIQLVSSDIYSNIEPNALFAYYTFDDGGTSAEDLCRRAKSSLLGYAYPHDTNVLAFLDQEYLYGDRAFALDSDLLKGAGNAFVFDANRVSSVIGVLDAERGEFDSDRDGLPDSWEIVHELNPFKKNTPDHDQIESYDPAWGVTEGPAVDWSRDVDLPVDNGPVGDGLDNINEYWAHTNPRKADTDEDGRFDGEEDFDGDNLPNRVEVQLGSRPDLADTDDDSIGESTEQATQTSPISSLSPLKNREVWFDGLPGSYFDVADRMSFRLTSWTLEAKVLPVAYTNLADGQGACVARRALQQTTNGLLGANFELRVVRMGTNLVAEARYIYVDDAGGGHIVSAMGSTNNPGSFVISDVTGIDRYPNGALTHMAATFDDLTGQFYLYVNGSKVAQNTAALTRPPINGRGPRSFVRVGEGFKGAVDDIRFWSTARSGAEIAGSIDTKFTTIPTNLVAYFRVDDGGWLAYPIVSPVNAIAADPSTVSTNSGDRYIINWAGAVGLWAGHEGQIAQFADEGGWLYFRPAYTTRTLVTNLAALYQFSTAGTWTAVSALPNPDPSIIRSVRYAVDPGVGKKEGDTWFTGANVAIFESGRGFTSPAPAKVFSEGVMLIGAAAPNEFAWWVSREEYDRFIGGNWLRWGPTVQWLADARVSVEQAVANEPALLALATPVYVGDTFFVQSVARFYTYRGGLRTLAASYYIEVVNDGDRFVDKASGTVYDFVAPFSLSTIATAATDGGGLYIFTKSDGVAWRSDGLAWKRWGFVPTTEDFTTTKDWLKQWASAAKLSGGGFFFALDTTASVLDSDGDGMPDDWEIAHGLDPFDPTGDNGAYGDPDEDGLWNINEYHVGTDPQNKDSDNNGVWDGDEDFDHDLLSNLVEQDSTGTRLDKVDTDDDFLTDWEEVVGPPNDFTNTNVWVYATNLAPQRVSNPLSSLDPPKQMSAGFSGNGRMLVPEQARHALTSWTLEAWVWPSNLADGIIIRRTVTNTLRRATAVNYELGVRTNEFGMIVPYARYIGLETNGLPKEIKVDGTVSNEVHGGNLATVAIPAEEWSHVAATYDPDAHTLSLYINGELASYRTDAYAPLGLGITEGSNYKSELTVGGGARIGNNVLKGFEGCIDEAMVLGGAVTAERVKKDAQSATALWASTHSPGATVTTVRQLPISQALTGEYAAGQLLVRFKTDVTMVQATNIIAGFGASNLKTFKIAPIHLIQFPGGMSISQKLAQVRANVNVLYAEPNYKAQISKIPNDPSYPLQWGMDNPSGGDIAAPKAWSRTIGSKEIIVAVIDTGIDYNHADLKDNMWVNVDEIPGNGIDDDGNGYVDDVYGYDFYNRDGDPMDDHGHGTHCAGTIGAVGNNGIGIAGVNWRVRLMALKFLNEFGGGYYSDAVDAIQYAWMNGAKISNNSWGGFGFSQSLYDAIAGARGANHLVVAAAGNWGMDNDGVFPFYPASFDLENIISVAASDRSDKLPWWSNYGKKSVDIAAPGVGVYSCAPSNSYQTMDGTSMAAPHVAGAAALLAAMSPGISYAVLKQAILEGVDSVTNLANYVLSGGRLNAANVVGSGGIPLAYFSFDDWGISAEDFTVIGDWSNNWSHAGTFFNAGFSSNSFLELKLDTDKDGMPDWWEIAVGLDRFTGSGEDGATGDPDGDGLQNYYEFRAGTNPFDSDTDHDGVTDFNEDADGDGLSNGQEQNLTHTDAALRDTDDDGKSDSAEMSASTDPLNSYSPENPRAAKFDGTGRLKVRTERNTDVMTNWTVEAWVRPANTNVSGIILRRAEKYAFPVNTKGFRWIDYEIGVSSNVPYTTYAYRQGPSQVVVRVAGIVALGTNWVHLAAVHDVLSSQLRLYVNGKRVAYQHPAKLAPVTRYGTFETVIGGGDLAGSTVIKGFQGDVDAVRVWDYVRTGVDIQDTRGVLLPEFLTVNPDSRRAAKRLFNFDDGGTSWQNSYYTNDWVTGWQHAAIKDTAGGVVLMASPFPPLALDSDDDAITDVSEHTGNWMDYRSESPYIPKAMVFNGKGGVFVDELVDSTPTMLYALTNWTVEAWIRPTAKPTNGVSLVTRRSWDGGWKTFEIGLVNTTGTVRAYARFNRKDAGHPSMMVVAGGASIRVGTNTTDWTHIAATFSSNTLILYVNGAEAIRGKQVGATPMVSMPGYLMLGWTNYIGELREVRIWNRSRTFSEIVDNMQNSLLFSAALKENSYDAASQSAAYLGRNTESIEDGYRYDYTAVGQLDNAFYIFGRLTHKFTMEAWIKMQPGAKGGIVTERKVDLMLIPNQPDWRPCNRLVITDNGTPKVEWQGQVQILTPVRESNIVIRFDSALEVVDRSLGSEVNIRDGHWHHLAAVGDSRRVRIYIDGLLDAESLSYYVFKARGGDSFESFYNTYAPIGSVLRVADNGIDAVIDEVMFWNEDKSAEEIRYHMTYGLARKDIRSGILPIDPLPENALDDSKDHVDLVSYITFDGQLATPFVPDEANDAKDYRMLPLPGGWEILANTRPPIKVDRLRAFHGLLNGYFAADDGGETVENYMQRNDWGYAGQFLAGSMFKNLAYNQLNDDVDGDGLPDWWETEHNLDPGSTEGLDGAWGDPDNDGLNNRAEYLAGTDPWNFDTYGTGFSDYDSRTNAGARTFGELYTDGDGMDDRWESLYPAALSPLRYDAQEDMDSDGWSNFAEFMFTGKDTNGVAVRCTDPTDLNSHPTPDISFVFKNIGTNISGPIRAQAYHAATMDGMPDASVSITVSNGLFPYLVTVRKWDQGWLREGRNWFFAFQDKNNDGTWNAGESAGMAQSQPINVGWGAVSNVVIGLTDTPQGYARFSWTPVAGALSYTVTVHSVSGVNGTWVIPPRTIKAPRTYFHEGDFQLVGTNGLPHGTYRWFVSASNGGFIASDYVDVLYPVTQTKPVPSQPMGSVVCARNEFSWSMDRSATQFRLQISPNATFSSILYDAVAITPILDVDGKYHYYPPLYAGDGWFTNRNYWWRLQGVNPRGRSALSAAQPFNVNLQESPSGAYTISGNVYYFGKVTQGAYVAQAFRSIGFSGVPDAQVTLTNKGPFKLMGLRGGIYYVRVFIDQNNNKQLDAWESWGVVQDSIFQIDYSIKALAVPGNKSGQKVVVRDRDTDNDNIPDAWEYFYFGNLATASSVSDWDGDGLTDLREYEIEPLDINPKLIDTDGDGISDYNEIWWDGSGSYNPYDPITNPTGRDLNPHKWSTDGSGVSDSNGDPDGDGLKNTLEFMMGTDPWTFTDLFGRPSVTPGNTADVIKFNIGSTVKNITTNFTARPMWATNLSAASWYPASACMQVVNSGNWRSGPWVKTNAHAAGKILYYRVDWSSP